MKCPNCKQDVRFNHTHDCVYGMPETHLEGTERYECENCGIGLYKPEGQKYGLRYVLD